MIGKAKWFQRRKYSGWGLTPKTWQGWAYVGAFIAIGGLIQILPLGNVKYNFYATLALVAVILIDVGIMMVQIPMDEREREHEAKAERNAMWTTLLVLILGLGWQVISSIDQATPAIDPVIIIAIIAAVLAKSLSNLYLDHKN